jgi:diguanylate cyclase
MAGARVLFLPSVLGTSAGIVLVYDHFERTNALAVGLAAATLALVMARTVLTFREVQRLHDSRRLSLTDDLTGLPNRRSFFDTLDAALAETTPSSDPMAVLMIDLDGFKELNDTLGHHAGDRVLMGIGPRLRSALRGDDRVARLGGDEFAILAPECDDDGILAARARVQRAVDEANARGGQPYQLSVSLGAAIFDPRAPVALESLMESADERMYQQKRAQVLARASAASPTDPEGRVLPS